MKKEEKKIYNVLIPNEVVRQFTIRCKGAGLKQNYVIAKLMEQFDPQIIFK